MRRAPVLKGYIDKQLRAAAERKHKKALMSIKSDIVRTRPPPVPRLVVYEKHQARDRNLQIHNEKEKIRAITAIEQKNAYERMMRSSKRNNVPDDFYKNHYMFTSRGRNPKKSLEDVERLVLAGVSQQGSRKHSTKSFPASSRNCPDVGPNACEYNEREYAQDLRAEDPNLYEREDVNRVVEGGDFDNAEEEPGMNAPEHYSIGSPVKATINIQGEEMEGRIGNAATDDFE